jgi:mannitol/fructose-specific phosphotransferase system IIA component (Ntr-type)
MQDLAEQISQFQFNLSPVTKSRFIKYLSDKLNEALFIRDHYAVKYILMSLKSLKVDY